MKRLVLTLAVALVTALSVSAQRLANIQVEARFITDKMVLELGLSNVQRNNILQLNLQRSVSSDCHCRNSIIVRSDRGDSPDRKAFRGEGCSG